MTEDDDSRIDRLLLAAGFTEAPIWPKQMDPGFARELTSEMLRPDGWKKPQAFGMTTVEPIWFDDMGDMIPRDAGKLLISFDVGVKRGVSVGYVVGDDSMHYIPIGDEMYDRLRSHEEIERLLREAGVSVTLVEHAAAGEPLTAAELVASIPVKDDLVDVPVRAPHDYLQHDPTKRVGKRRRGGRFGAGGKPTKHCFIGRKP